MDNHKTTMLIKFTDSKKFRNMQTSKEEIIRANTWVCVSGTELQSLNIFFHSIFKWSFTAAELEAVRSKQLAQDHPVS